MFVLAILKLEFTQEDIISSVGLKLDSKKARKYMY